MTHIINWILYAYSTPLCNSSFKSPSLAANILTYFQENKQTNKQKNTNKNIRQEPQSISTKQRHTSTYSIPHQGFKESSSLPALQAWVAGARGSELYP